MSPSPAIDCATVAPPSRARAGHAVGGLRARSLASSTMRRASRCRAAVAAAALVGASAADLLGALRDRLRRARELLDGGRVAPRRPPRSSRRWRRPPRPRRRSRCTWSRSSAAAASRLRGLLGDAARSSAPSPRRWRPSPRPRLAISVASLATRRARRSAPRRAGAIAARPARRRPARRRRAGRCPWPSPRWWRRPPRWSRRSSRRARPRRRRWRRLSVAAASSSSLAAASSSALALTPLIERAISSSVAAVVSATRRATRRPCAPRRPTRRSPAAAPSMPRRLRARSCAVVGTAACERASVCDRGRRLLDAGRDRLDRGAHLLAGRGLLVAAARRAALSTARLRGDLHAAARGLRQRCATRCARRCRARPCFGRARACRYPVAIA